MQFKKGELTGFVVKTPIEAATKATIKMYTLGYATQGKDYLPTFRIGSSATAILCNEGNNGTVNVSGVDTGLKYTQSGTEKVIYEYTLTYDLSALSGETLKFVTAKSGATYLGSIVVENEAAPAGNPLPLAADKDTKVEGAGFWVYLDNTNLGITGANAADILATAKITVTLEEGNTPESAQAAVTGFLGSAAKTQAETLGDVLQFDSYEGNSVRLYFTVQAGVDASWQMKHTVAIELTIGGVTYASSLVFIGGVLQA